MSLYFVQLSFAEHAYFPRSALICSWDGSPYGITDQHIVGSNGRKGLPRFSTNESNIHTAWQSVSFFHHIVQQINKSSVLHTVYWSTGLVIFSVISSSHSLFAIVNHKLAQIALNLLTESDLNWEHGCSKICLGSVYIHNNGSIIQTVIFKLLEILVMVTQMLCSFIVLHFGNRYCIVLTFAYKTNVAFQSKRCGSK